MNNSNHLALRNKKFFSDSIIPRIILKLYIKKEGANCICGFYFQS